MTLNLSVYVYVSLLVCVCVSLYVYIFVCVSLDLFVYTRCVIKRTPFSFFIIHSSDDQFALNFYQLQLKKYFNKM